ncbi:MAG: hypothetical protein EA369_03765 [Bradymonadales bacterium]|nr:MAG: hypothetical protein EA369_03765 [Bradymonadales bacterium]
MRTEALIQTRTAQALFLFIVGLFLGACQDRSMRDFEFVTLEDRVKVEMGTPTVSNANCPEPRDSNRDCLSVRLSWSLTDRVSLRALAFHPFQLEIFSEEVLEAENVIRTDKAGQLSAEFLLQVHPYTRNDLREIPIRISSSQLGSFLFQLNTREIQGVAQPSITPLEKAPNPELLRARAAKMNSRTFATYAPSWEFVQRESLDGEFERVRLRYRAQIIDEKTGAAIPELPLSFSLRDQRWASSIRKESSTDRFGNFSLEFDLLYSPFEHEYQQRIDLDIQSAEELYPDRSRWSFILNLSESDRNPLILAWRRGTDRAPANWQNQSFLPASTEAQRLHLSRFSLHRKAGAELSLDEDLNLLAQSRFQFESQVEVESLKIQGHSKLLPLSNQALRMRIFALKHRPNEGEDLLALARWEGEAETNSRGQISLRATLKGSEPLYLDEDLWLLMEVRVSRLAFIPPQWFLVSPGVLPQVESFNQSPHFLVARPNELTQIDEVGIFNQDRVNDLLNQSPEQLMKIEPRAWESLVELISASDSEVHSLLTAPAKGRTHLEIYQLHVLITEEGRLPLTERASISLKRTGPERELQLGLQEWGAEISGLFRVCLLLFFERDAQSMKRLVCSPSPSAESLKWRFFQLRDTSPQRSLREPIPRWLLITEDLPSSESLKSFEDWLQRQRRLQFFRTRAALIHSDRNFQLRIR